jgi:hypothetical protein
LFGWTALGVQVTVDVQRFLLPMYIGAATLIGTMVVLAVNLSLIPVQRAAERYASSVVRIFREDPLTTVLIVVLAGCSVLLYALAVRGLLVGQPPGWIGVPIVVVAIAFDLMRWHHRRTTRLLEPSEAISRLAAQATAAIDRLQRQVARLAQLNWRLMPEQERESRTVEMVESRLYLGERSHVAVLVHWLSELAEVALKALDRGDDLATRQATAAIATVAAHYLERRKNNLVLDLANFAGTLRSEGYDVLEPALLNLRQLVARATAKKHEGVATAGINSLAELTARSAALDGKPFEERAGVLTWLPLGYLSESIKIAQRGDLGESALEGSRSLLRLAAGLPSKVRIEEAHLSIVTAWRDIAVGFLAAGQGEIARDPIGNLVRMNWVLLERGHWQLNECLHESLDALRALAPIIFALEQKNQAFDLLRLPLSTAYDLSDQASLPYLVQQAATRVKRDPDREWVNPYGNFIRLNEVIHRHLRELAETPGCGASALMWYLGRMVGYVAKVHRQLLAKPVTDDREHLSELARSVSWYVACLWAGFNKTPPSDVRWADSVVDEIATVGMYFCDAGFKDVTADCGSAIKSIARSCVKGVRSPYDIADLLMGIWKLRLFAEAKGAAETVRALDPMLERPPEVAEDQWKFVEQALALRKRQLEAELKEIWTDPVRFAMSEPERLIAQSRREARKAALKEGRIALLNLLRERSR